MVEDSTLAGVLPRVWSSEFDLRHSPETLSRMARMSLDGLAHVRFPVWRRLGASPAACAEDGGGRWSGFDLHLGVRGVRATWHVRSSRDIYFAWAAAYVSETLLGRAAAPDNVRRLLDLKVRIERALRGAYSATDRANFSTGGAPGLKEIILYSLIRRTSPKLVVETGVAQGVSSTFILQALEDAGAGNLISVDLPFFEAGGHRYESDRSHLDRTYVKPELGVGWLVPESLRPRWTLRLGSSADVLPQLGDPEVDLFFHDSEHSFDNMAMELAWGFGHLRRGGAIVSDDVWWNAAFSTFVRERGAELNVMCRSPIGVCQKVS